MGFLSGLGSYFLYFYIPVLIFSFLSSSLSVSWSSSSSTFNELLLPSINWGILLFFILLSVISSLLWNSWLGFIFDVFTSSIYFTYALIALDFGRLTLDVSGFSLTINFYILLIIWFVSYILDLLAKLFNLIEKEANFLPTFF